jgi:hypothetical protein
MAGQALSAGQYSAPYGESTSDPCMTAKERLVMPLHAPKDSTAVAARVATQPAMDWVEEKEKQRINKKQHRTTSIT